MYINLSQVFNFIIIYDDLYFYLFLEMDLINPLITTINS